MLDGILIADSVGKEHGLKNGSTASVGMAKESLNVAWFK